MPETANDRAATAGGPGIGFDLKKIRGANATVQTPSHPGRVIWLTGLSASGKSTIAAALEEVLAGLKRPAYVLDGDEMRRGLCSDLGFSPEHRKENIRRVGEVAKLFADAGLICIAAFISPYRADRELVRNILPPGRFIEVFVNAPVEVCAARDPKGLYRKARAGELQNFTGVSAPYEVAHCPEIELRTDQISVADCVRRILDHLTLNPAEKKTAEQAQSDTSSRY